MSQHFGREQRLLTAKQFDVVFRGGQKAFAKPFTVIFKPNQLSYARIGFAISKKKVRLATQRNRLKRIARECFRREIAHMQNNDLVVLATMHESLSNVQLHRAICRLFVQLCVDSSSPVSLSTKN